MRTPLLPCQRVTVPSGYVYRNDYLCEDMFKEQIQTGPVIYYRAFVIDDLGVRGYWPQVDISNLFGFLDSPLCWVGYLGWYYIYDHTLPTRTSTSDQICHWGDLFISIFENYSLLNRIYFPKLWSKGDVIQASKPLTMPYLIRNCSPKTWKKFGVLCYSLSNR